MSDLLAKVQLQITYFVVFEVNFEYYYLWHANAFLFSGLSIVSIIAFKILTYKC